MKTFWYASKGEVMFLILWGILLFLILYEYPVLGAVDGLTLTGGVPTLILYIWILNTFYIISTGVIVYWMFKHAEKIQWKKKPQKEGA
ncbi:MAG: hypothetical protein HXS53_11180 [Theionarchaea archaeon]|nr:hypothetical protein [Theionarchaea archaeon]